MRIVTNGTHYAIEKGWLFKRYLDLEVPNYWWSKNNYVFRSCVTIDIELVKKRWATVNSKFKPIHESELNA